MSTSELACTYAALILHDDGIPVTEEKIAALVKAAGVSIEPYWPNIFAKLLSKTSVEDLIMNAGSSGAAPAAAPAAGGGGGGGGGDAGGAAEKEAEPEEEEEEEDMEFDLFD